MTAKTEGRAPFAFLLSEAQGTRSRAALLIAASMTILAGQVVGKVGTNEGAVTVGAPAFTGTGDGVLTRATPAYGAGVQEGTYTARLIEAGANLGEFAVMRPDGTLDGYATVGSAYDGQVKFTIADGSTDFSAAAQFPLAVTIAAASAEGQYKALDLSATDGAEHAAAIAGYAVTTGVSETSSIAGVVRDAEVNGNELEWPSGITADQKSAAIAELAAVGIIVR